MACSGVASFLALSTWNDSGVASRLNVASSRHSVPESLRVEASGGIVHCLYRLEWHIFLVFDFYIFLLYNFNFVKFVIGQVQMFSRFRFHIVLAHLEVLGD